MNSEFADMERLIVRLMNESFRIKSSFVQSIHQANPYARDCGGRNSTFQFRLYVYRSSID